MILALLSSLVLLSTAFAQHCSDPKISDIRTHSTNDPNLYDEASYVVEFRVKCAGNTKNVVFYTEINGKYIASTCDETGERHQFSWSEPIEKSRSGYVNVKIFDEDSLLALKKAQRNQADTSNVKPIQTISFYHYAQSKKQFIQFEFIAVIIAGIVLFVASSNKNKILA